MSEPNELVSEKSPKSGRHNITAGGGSVSQENNSKTSVAATTNNNNDRKDKDNSKDKKGSLKGSGKRRKNQMPSKKRSGGNGFVLSKEDIYYLKTHTRYDEKEIKEWYRGFKHDCPNGQLTKQTIIDICNQILPGGNSSTFVDQIFRIFDKDNSGTIDFKEFMLATDMTSAGTAEEKLAWAFKMYDKDDSGTIELSEMTDIIGTLYDMEGVTSSGGEGNITRATRIFSELDINGDGELTCDEFIRGCMQDKDLIRMLSSGGLHPDEAEADDYC